MLHKSPPAGPHGAGVRGRRRRRRHLVLEPLPGRPLRHREHGVLLRVRRGPAAGVGVDRALRAAARDPAATPSTSPTASTSGADITFDTRVTSATYDEATCTVAGADRPGPRRHRAVPRDGHRLPVVGQHARHPRQGRLRGPDLPHGPLAPRGRRLHRPAGRHHRHRLLGAPVDPDHRRAGGAPHRVPAHRHLRGAGVEPAARPRRGGQGQGQLRRVPRRQPPDAERVRRVARPTPSRPRWRSTPEERQARFEERWAHGGLPFLGAFTDLLLDARGQRAGRRVRARPHPSRRDGPGRGRAARPRPGHRLQAPLRRHRVLRDLQPRQRAPRRPAGDADRAHHADRHADHRRAPRGRQPSSSPPASTR